MPRPTSVAMPQQAIDAVASVPQAELPSIDLPNFPEIPDVPAEVPAGDGIPSLSAPEFPDLELPGEAETDVGIPAAHLPDFIFDAI